jgi:hypothetical protein
MGRRHCVGMTRHPLYPAHVQRASLGSPRVVLRAPHNSEDGRGVSETIKGFSAPVASEHKPGRGGVSI